MNSDSINTREVRDILHTYGLGTDDISLAGGFANLVMMTPAVVVRLNEGRFPLAFAHEARVLAHLPSEIPHPKVVAQGPRAGGGEYLILERLPGERLDLAWASLSEPARERVAGSLARIVKRLHILPPSPWMANPWVEDAMRMQRWRDAYHASPDAAPLLIESAAAIRPDAAEVLERLATFVAGRMSAVGGEPDVFLHTDLHLRNVLVDGEGITGLIDYEGSRPGPADVELDMLVRSLHADFGTGSDARAFIDAFRQGYPALFSHPRLVERLEVYEALWHLVQLHHWKPGDRWTSDPADALVDLLDGAFAAQVSRVLAIS